LQKYSSYHHLLARSQAIQPGEHLQDFKFFSRSSAITFDEHLRLAADENQQLAVLAVILPVSA